MRNSLFIIIPLMVIISCSDEKIDCSKEGWIGTYIGTKACQGEIQEDYKFKVISVTLSADPAPDNFLMIDDQLYKFQDCTLATGTIGDTDFKSLGSLDGRLLTIETDSCNWEAIRQ